MYEIQKNVKAKDFDTETKNFLLDIGFSQDDDLSSMFQDFLKKEYSVSNLYADNEELEKSSTYQYRADEIETSNEKKNKCLRAILNIKADGVYHSCRGICLC